LKAVVWSDLIQGAALLMGGILVTWLGLRAVGGVGSFLSTNADKLHMILPSDHVDYPWTILLVGIWVPNLFYWGLNQFITQRALGAKSVAEGQRGILFAAMLKLLIPFIIIMPGIMAWQLYGSQITDVNEAYPVLMRNILPAGLRGIMFAALFGAVMSSLDSMLNSASTILTIDLYKRHRNPDADPKMLVKFGRIATGAFVLIACLWAPLLAGMESVFDYVQTFWGFISPGIVAVFLFGIFSKRAPASAAVTGMVASIPIYALLTYLPWPGLDYTNNMGLTCLLVVAIMAVMTRLRPLSAPVEMPQRVDIDLTASPGVRAWGMAIVVATVGLYIIFW
jgi:SSS family solute:Na+ symporter